MPDAGSPPVAARKFPFPLTWLVAWAVVSLFLVLAFRGISWESVVEPLRAAHLPWVVAAVVANGLILVVGTVQWRLFLPPDRPVGFGRMFWVQAITATVANGGPLLTGPALGLHLLATRGGVGHATAAFVTAVDQLAEGVSKLCLLAALAWFVPLPMESRAPVFTLLVGLPLLAVGMVAAGARAPSLQRWAEKMAPGRFRSAMDFLASVARHLKGMNSLRVMGGGSILAVGQKVAEVVAAACVAHALGVPVTPWVLLLVVASINFSTMLSVTPGNLGIYEGAAFLAYRAGGVAPDTALAMAVLQHLAYLIPLAGTGWLLMLVGRPPEKVDPPLDGAPPEA
ncbi:MAG: flippase-like domain-containing protein [Gemmatimonadota bacterium]|nr:flippase-like domain-containing protein [Gemmatimonadota bacterium]